MPGHSTESDFTRGNVLARTGKLREAAEHYQRFLQTNPNHLDALTNLGNVLYMIGRADEATELYRHVLAIQPGHFLARNNLSAALVAIGQYAEAAQLARAAIAARPDYPATHRNLGDALASLGDWPAAAASYKTLVDLDTAQRSPNPSAAADARMKLANAMQHLGRFSDAVALFRQAMALAPADIEPRDSLAHAYWAKGDMDNALAICRQTAKFHPRNAKVQNNLGMVLLECGELDQALAAFDKATEADPSDTIALNNRIFTTLFHPDYDSAKIHAGARRLAQRLTPQTPPSTYSNDRSPDRRLRVGFVSADLRDHAAGRNILPLFQCRDRANFEFYCYSNGSEPDAFNQKFRTLSEGWREIARWPDDQAAAQIRDDKIDVLIDLSLHMGGNRLGLFARKPAPIQVTFGYPGTTGLSAIDYRFTDPNLDPPGVGDDAYAEKSVRLPHSFWCYDPGAMEVADWPDPGPPPAISAGRISFGCLNNFRKINDRVLQLWTGVLREVHSSRIQILAPHGSHRDALSARLAQLGVDPARIGFIDRGSRTQYLDAYRDIDIALDTIPYNGHTTSLDAMWLGVPVVTLIGQTIAGRAGLSQAQNLDLMELVAQTPQQFISIAASLARNLDHLAELRNSLRSRMKPSPICDAAGWTLGIEGALRQIWQDWCRNHG